MKRIDTLISRANAVRGVLEVTWISLRNIRGNEWDVIVDLWDLKPGSARGREDWRKKASFDSGEAACDFIGELLDSYPPTRKIPLWIDCVALGGPLAPIMIGG